jgi:hypothetical protein
LQQQDRSRWIKKILDTQWPESFSRQRFVLEALPHAMHASVLATVQLACKDFTVDELKVLFNKIGMGFRRTKLEVLYSLTMAINETDIPRLLLFMETTPHLVSIHKEIWETIFLTSDLFVQLVTKLRHYKP